MSQLDFEKQVLAIAKTISARPLDKALEDYLNEQFPASGEVFQSLAESCVQGVEEGWLCRHEQAGIKFGRVIKPLPESYVRAR